MWYQTNKNRVAQRTCSLFFYGEKFSFLIRSITQVVLVLVNSIKSNPSTAVQCTFKKKLI